MDKENLSVQCRLIQAYTTVNPKKAEELSEKLLSTSGEKAVDVDQLEDSDYILYGEKYRQKKDAKAEPVDTVSVVATSSFRRKSSRVSCATASERGRFDYRRTSTRTFPPIQNVGCRDRRERRTRRNSESVIRREMWDVELRERSRRQTPPFRQCLSSYLSVLCLCFREVENSPKPTPIQGEGPRQQRPPGQQPKKKKAKKGGKW